MTRKHRKEFAVSYSSNRPKWMTFVVFVGRLIFAAVFIMALTSS